MAAGRQFAIEALTVRSDRVVAQVRCQPGARTTPALAETALRQHPNLARHACVNRKGSTFGAVIQNTPVPHLFEHLAIDLLVQRTDAADGLFTGTSEWEDEATGTARVEVSYRDDIEALAAMRDAADLLDSLLSAQG